MKKTTFQTIAIVIMALLFCFADNVMAQNVTKDQQGNYVTTTKPRSKAKDTGKKYTDKEGKTYPVLISANGKLFVRRISKNGNEYNYYLKID